MSDASKISQGITLNASVDQMAAQVAGQSMAQAVNTGFESRMQQFDVGTKIADKIVNNLSTTLTSGAERQLGNLEKKLLGITTSMSRGRFDDTVERQLNRYIELAQRFGQEWHKVIGQQTQSIFKSFTTPQYQAPVIVAGHPSGAFGQGIPAAYSGAHPSGAFGVSSSNHGQNKDDELYQYKLLEMEERQRRVEDDRESRKQKRNQFALDTSSQRRDNETAARVAAVDERRRYTKTLQSQQILNDPKIPATPDLSNKTQSNDTLLAARKLRKLEAHDAEIDSENATAEESFQAARNRKNRMLQKMAGDKLDPLLHGSIPEHHQGLFEQKVGGLLRSSAGQRSTKDMDTSAFIKDRRTKDAAYEFVQFKEMHLKLNAEANKDLAEYVNDNKKWMKKKGLTTNISDGLLGYEAQAALQNLRDLEDKHKTGGLSKSGSHRLRFATQNFAFGIDDAIQSYHYGGVGASIRAASNNATAIAGMAISNPMIAAASVVALSAASSILPKVIEHAIGIIPQVSDAELLKSRIGVTGQYETTKAKGGDTMSLTREGILDSIGGMKALNKESELTLSALELAKKNSQMQWDTASVDHEDDWDKTSMRHSRQATEFLQWGLNMGTYGEEKTLEKNHAGLLQKRLEERQKQDILMEKYEGEKAQWEAQRVKRLDDTVASRRVDQSMTQGSFGSGKDLKEAMEANLTRRLGVIDAGDKDPIIKRLLGDQLRQQHAEETGDTWGMNRQVRNANLNRTLRLSGEDRQDRAELYGYSGDNGRVGRVELDRNQFNASNKDRYSRLDAAYNNGELSLEDHTNRVAEFNNMTEAKKASYSRNRKRAVEDDLEELNPERNPLKRQAKMLEKIKEDLALREGLSPAEKEDQARAALTAAERRQDEFMIGGKRNFVSHSMVGSVEDEELRARMTGNFGPTLTRDNHKGESLGELNRKMDKLIEQLNFTAQQFEQ